MKATVTRWGYEMAADPVRPGIYRLTDGRLLVRAMVTVGKQRKDRKRVLDPGAGMADAVRAKEALEREAATEMTTEARPSLPLWSEYADALQERKIARGRIKSAAGVEKWGAIVLHHLVPTFGAMRLDEIKRKHVQAWLDDQAALVNAGKAKPSTVNTRLAILRTILRAASRDHGLVDPSAGLEAMPCEEHPTYTDEQPNALTVDELRRFLDATLHAYPQFYAMVLLGFYTGQRPSHMQPLRRQGPEADILWNEGVMLIRRSHTRGQKAMNTTKTGKRQRIALPAEVMGVLRWHVMTQLRTDEQMASDLLFPSDLGTMRHTSVLHPVFVEVARAIGLRKKISPRGMRRTFQDLMRAAGVHDLVARSLSGHATPAMQAHYSTVGGEEQRRAGASVLRLLAPALPRTQPDPSYTPSYTEVCEPVKNCDRSEVG